MPGVEVRYALGAYLRPARPWVLPLGQDLADSPPLELDLAFDDLAPDEQVEIRSIAVPVSVRTRRRAWGSVEALRAGRQPMDGGLTRDLVHGVTEALREMLAFGLTGQAHASRPRGVTRESTAAAGVAEAKARSRLVDLQLQILVRAPDKRRARDRLAVAVAAFDPLAGPFNWLVMRRPWRRRAFARVFDREQPWPGATFTASAEEAALLTGRPRREFDGLRTRRVWTRRRARAGRVPHDADLFLGQAPDG